MQKLLWSQTRQPKPISELRDDVNAEVLAVLDKMMAKDPADRYQEPIEAARALEPWADDAPAPEELLKPRTRSAPASLHDLRQPAAVDEMTPLGTRAVAPSLALMDNAAPEAVSPQAPPPSKEAPPAGLGSVLGYFLLTLGVAAGVGVALYVSILRP